MATLQEQHFAIVADNNDPDKMGRVKVRSQSLVGANVQLPDWIPPHSSVFNTLPANNGKNGGALFLPEVNSIVELVADTHDTEYDQVRNERFLQNPNLRWKHAPFNGGDQPTPDALKVNYPNRRGIVSPTGHFLVFDDKDKKIIVEDSNGNRITLSESEISIVNASSSVKVRLGTLSGGEEFVALATKTLNELSAIVNSFNSHTHLAGSLAAPNGPVTGTSGTPVVTMNSPQSVAAQNVKAD